MDTAVRDKITETLVERRARQFTFLQDLIALDTVGGNDTLADKAKTLAGWLDDLGLEAEILSPSDDERDALGHGPISNIVVRCRFGDGPVVALVSHVDTQAPSDGWSVPPQAGIIRDGKILGLGAVSGKGHLAAQVFALLALQDAGTDIRGTIELHISFDGMSGELGAQWLLGSGAVSPQMAIVGGPARSVAVYGKGVLGMSVQVLGAGAPAFAPDGGRDALEAATQAMARLYQFRPGLKAHKSDIPGIGAPSLVIERIDGGTVGAGVPDEVTFCIDRRLTPQEDPAQIEAQLTKLIGATIAKSPGVRAKIRRVRLLPPMTGGDAVTPMRAALGAGLAHKLGVQPPSSGVGYDHEGRFYVAKGIPTVLYGAGPADAAAAGMGGVDETLDLDDLRLGTEVLALGLGALLAPRA